MNTDLAQENAVAAIRISSIKQGLQGDSPEAQKEQIESFAANHNINIRKFFVFIESASKEQQPIQEAINYCKNPKNDVQLFIIKSIDRFTRGGSYSYDHLKMQLTKYGVRLVDIYGIIGAKDVNTLEHLGIEYNWSVYSPTKKTEILEAERAKDEMRDIMTRMIGAEIRYVRMGYRVRQAPLGYENEKVETPHGKRVILKPHPKESVWIKKMFELRVRGNLTDTEIVDEVNKLGFRTRTRNKRSKRDKKKIVGTVGGKKLTLKQLWRYIKKPIYAGVSVEKWTDGKAIQAKFDGLVDIETYNKANRGKRTLIETKEGIKFHKKKTPKHLLTKGVHNKKFPYKKYVMCPKCEKPLYGSASRGKMGKYYPAYHCNKRGHYFRVPKKDFDETIESFVKGLKVTPDYAEKLMKAIIEEWEKRQKSDKTDKAVIEEKIQELENSARMTADKIKMLNSETAIRYMEKDLEEREREMAELKEQLKQTDENAIDIREVTDTVEYFLEHLEELLLDGDKPLKEAALFRIPFQRAPTYEELDSGTPDLAPFIGLKDDYDVSYSQMVTLPGFEPGLPG